MLKISLWLLAAVLLSAALFPSKYSREHPTEFLERSAIGRMVLANAQSTIDSTHTLVERSTNPLPEVR